MGVDLLPLGVRRIGRALRVAGAVGLGLLAILAFPAPASACTADVGQMERPDRAFSLAFIGRVDRVTYNGETGYMETVRFQVRHVLAGPTAPGPLHVEIDGCHPLGFRVGQDVMVTTDLAPAWGDPSRWEFGGYTTWAWEVRGDRAEPLYAWEPEEREPPGPASAAAVLAFIERGIRRHGAGAPTATPTPEPLPVATATSVTRSPRPRPAKTASPTPASVASPRPTRTAGSTPTPRSTATATPSAAAAVASPTTGSRTPGGPSTPGAVRTGTVPVAFVALVVAAVSFLLLGTLGALARLLTRRP